MSKYKRLSKDNWELFSELFKKSINKNSLPIASSTQLEDVLRLEKD